jgi:hypothetical protein
MTGFPFVDALMRELHNTGYMCHWGRETAAWFLVCDLGLDWRMGAEWFESNLIDYEPAANWFNWTFMCLPRATGGKEPLDMGYPALPPLTRLQTAEVIFVAAQNDPDAEYIKKWVPELAKLAGPLAREPWRIGFTPAAAVKNARDMTGSPPVGPDKMQMARKTLTKGGAQVAVWWDCCRSKGASTSTSRNHVSPEWPEGYPLPLCSPSSFFTIEAVADAARMEQKEKAERMQKLRDTLGFQLAVKANPSEGKPRDDDAVKAHASSEYKSLGKGKNKGVGKGKRKGDRPNQLASSYYGNGNSNGARDGGTCMPVGSGSRRRWRAAVAS